MRSFETNRTSTNACATVGSRLAAASSLTTQALCRRRTNVEMYGIVLMHTTEIASLRKHHSAVNFARQLKLESSSQQYYLINNSIERKQGHRLAICTRCSKPQHLATVGHNWGEL
jgi:hypothetical protein